VVRDAPTKKVEQNQSHCQSRAGKENHYPKPTRESSPDEKSGSHLAIRVRFLSAKICQVKKHSPLQKPTAHSKENPQSVKNQLRFFAASH
jgi:hypothetical protein